MKTYSGTKTVKARPMTRGDYNVYQGWAMPANENSLDDGYLVEYLGAGRPNKEGHADYISWSPKDVFEEVYKELVDTPSTQPEVFNLLNTKYPKGTILRADMSGAMFIVKKTPDTLTSLYNNTERFYTLQLIGGVKSQRFCATQKTLEEDTSFQVIEEPLSMSGTEEPTPPSPKYNVGDCIVAQSTGIKYLVVSCPLHIEEDSVYRTSWVNGAKTEIMCFNCKYVDSNLEFVNYKDVVMANSMTAGQTSKAEILANTINEIQKDMATPLAKHPAPRGMTSCMYQIDELSFQANPAAEQFTLLNSNYQQGDVVPVDTLATLKKANQVAIDSGVLAKRTNVTLTYKYAEGDLIKDISTDKQYTVVEVVTLNDSTGNLLSLYRLRLLTEESSLFVHVTTNQLDNDTRFQLEKVKPGVFNK